MLARYYQSESLDALAQGIREKHVRQILSAPTGSGKTYCGMILAEAAMKKGSRTAFICDRTALIEQTSEAFDAHGIEHGIIQANHWRWRPGLPVQICSAQTLARRGVPDGLKLIIVDEAHTCYKSTTDFLLANPDIITVGLTATPFSKGLGNIYTRVVNVTTTDKLVSEGFLSPLKVFAAVPIDMKGAKLKFDGEWDDKEIEKRAMVVVGDVVKEWIAKTTEHFGGPVKTILFSASVAHGEALCNEFQAAGHNFKQVSYRDGNDESRAALIAEFRKDNSSVTGLVSVEALAKGFDVPDILCGVSCKPYRKSLSGHIQQLGRVMRSSPGKTFALWLDHSGNYLRFRNDTDEFFANGIQELDDGKHDSKVHEDPDEKEKKLLVCAGCGYAQMTPAMTRCPACGLERKRHDRTANVAGEMVEIKGNGKAEFKHEWMRDKQGVWQQIVGYALQIKADRQKAEKFALAQYRNLYGEWPRYAMRNVEPADPTLPVVNKIRSMQIAWAHRRRA